MKIMSRLASFAFSLTFATGLSLGGLLSPSIALAQKSFNLPSLGDPDSEELSPASERRLGAQVMQQLRRESVVLEDSELTDWVSRFAAPLVRTPQAAGYDFEFFWVKDSSLNAFALPGGYIGLHTGLMMVAQTESELAAVMGHEISHVTQRHLARQFGKQRLAGATILASLLLAVLAARSNPDALIGITQLGEHAARQQVLGFSRDAEREADRLGLDMLSQAGFDPLGSLQFFNRLQNASRIYDSNAPAYFRTHPLTTERISDMQTRTLGTRYRQRPDSLEFSLIKARIRALNDVSPSGLQDAVASFEQQLRNKSINEGVAWYGIAIAQSEAQNDAASQAALKNAMAKLGDTHPMVIRQNIRQAIKFSRFPEALALAEKGLAANPNSRPLSLARIEATMANQQWQRASGLLKDELQLRRSDAELWRLASEVHSASAEPALAHRAAAERLALQGAWLGAIEQITLAQKVPNKDFVTASIIDARRRDFQEQWRRERNDPINKDEPRRPGEPERLSALPR